MGTLNIRIIGASVIWILSGFKIPFKQSVNNFASFVIGSIVIIIVAFLCFYFWTK